MTVLRKIKLGIALILTMTVASSSALAEFAPVPQMISMRVSANPYYPAGGEPLVVRFSMEAAGELVTAYVKIFEVSTNLLVMEDQFRAGTGDNQFSWNGKQLGNRQPAPTGTYKITISGTHILRTPSDGILSEISSTFQVISPYSLDDVVLPEDLAPAGTGTEGGGLLTESTGLGTATGAGDVIDCVVDKNNLELSSGTDQTDKITMQCNLGGAAAVSVGIYKTDFDPIKTDNSASLIKLLVDKKAYTQAESFAESWNGKDDLDQTVEPGEYVMVGQAKADTSFAYDFSIQKITVTKMSVEIPSPPAPLPQGEGSSQGTTTSSTSESIPGQARDEGAAQGESLAGQPSKCVEVNYPVDLPVGGLEKIIIQGYDECLVSGFEDGTFRQDSSLTRAEALKIALLAGGYKPKDGCFTNDCGSPFRDLDFWQGKWVRAAWDERIVTGLAPNYFGPNWPVSRAEGAALTVKALAKSTGIEPHQGCYTANCGAGHPNNFFLDVFKMWEGPYLRALWDKGAAKPTGANSFSPERAITRGEFLEMVLLAKG